MADRSTIWNADLFDALELDALYRSECRDARVGEDRPERYDDRFAHTPSWRDGEGRVRLGSRSVHLSPLSNEVQPLPRAERVY